MIVTKGFVIRRLAPDSQKAELGKKAGAELHGKLLEAMGREIGSLHAVTATADTIQKDLRKRDPGWLHAASKVAQTAVIADYKSWSDR